jgi:GNAT superfamily N-acetyltransferase
VDPPRPAARGSQTDLLELLQEVRRELGKREEAPSGAWVESTTGGLRAGTQPGWLYPPSDGGGGIGFATLRGRRLWGHVHSNATEARGERAFRLGEAILEGAAPEVATIGFTGLSEAEERSVVERLAQRPGSTVIERFAMERELGPEDDVRAAEPPAGLRRVPIREVTLDALADLDWRAFRGSVDDLMVGGSVAEYHRILSGLLTNNLGRFLDEASTVLVDTEATRLIAGVLTSEVTARQALFLDLMVDPEERRHGVGRFLIGWSFRALRALGYARVRLWVTAANAAAVRLYETEGFSRVGTTTLYRWDGGGAAPQAQASR